MEEIKKRGWGGRGGRNQGRYKREVPQVRRSRKRTKGDKKLGIFGHLEGKRKSLKKRKGKERERGDLATWDMGM